MLRGAGRCAPIRRSGTPQSLVLGRHGERVLPIITTTDCDGLTNGEHGDRLPLAEVVALDSLLYDPQVPV